MRLADAVREAVLRSSGLPGAASLARGLGRVASTRSGSYVALTYHRVDEPGRRPWLLPSLLSATPQQFEDQMRMLRHDFRPVSMAQVLAAYRGSSRLPPRAVLVTFDDAYRDFAEQAWPIMRRLDVPVTLFVPTAYPSGSPAAFWWDRLWQALTAERRGELGVMEEALTVIQAMKALPHPTLVTMSEAVASGREGDVPDVLDWDELDELARQGVALAPHSHEHPLLGRLPATAVQDEVERSVAELLQHVPRDSVVSEVFAYPSGSYSDEAARVIAGSGIELAFTTDRGVNSVDAPAQNLKLRRINVGVRTSTALLEGQLNAFLMLNRLRATRRYGPRAQSE